ncbi:MAG: immunoglobulin-like domain-containing protein [bacterium]
MNKLKLLLLFISIIFIFISCSDTTNEISFTLKPGLDTINLNSEYTDPGAEAYINGEIQDYEVTENTVDTSQIGIYYITYELPTHGNNIYVLTRIITVIDEIPPEISLNPGIDTIKIGQEWTDSSVTVSDNSNEEITIETIGEVDNTTRGRYSITYIATDAYGNQSEITRIVNVTN